MTRLGRNEGSLQSRAVCCTRRAKRNSRVLFSLRHVHPDEKRRCRVERTLLRGRVMALARDQPHRRHR
jgi:hypothetical protein